MTNPLLPHYILTTLSDPQGRGNASLLLDHTNKKIILEEIIELHVYNQSRGIWTKMPMKVTINPECVIKTLEELENWTKESWSTH
jgi:hypothetical protein